MDTRGRRGGSAPLADHTGETPACKEPREAVRSPGGTRPLGRGSCGHALLVHCLGSDTVSCYLCSSRQPTTEKRCACTSTARRWRPPPLVGCPDPGKGFFTIGGAIDNAAGWAGTVDEVAIYRRVLTPAQLKLQGTTGSGFGHSPYPQTVRAPGGLLGYWRLDDRKGANAIDSGGQTAGIYGTQVEQKVPGLIRGDADTAARFEGFGSDVIFQPPPRAQLAHGMTVEAWATATLGGGRALVGKTLAYSIGLDRGGHWQTSVVIREDPRPHGHRTQAGRGIDIQASPRGSAARRAGGARVIGGRTHTRDAAERPASPAPPATTPARPRPQPALPPRRAERPGAEGGASCPSARRS